MSSRIGVVHTSLSLYVNVQTNPLPITSAAIVSLPGFIDYGAINLGACSILYTQADLEWAISDGSIFQRQSRYLGSYVYGRSGSVFVRAPRVNPPYGVVGDPTQSGVGSVSLSRPTSRRTLFPGLAPSSASVTPILETSGADIGTNWTTITGIVDVTVKSSTNSPGYRIYGSGLYGPTGYWVTKTLPVLRIGSNVVLQWSANDYELSECDYSLSIGGTVVATGTMADNTTASYQYACTAAGIFDATLTLSDANGITEVLPLLTMTVYDAPLLTGSFQLPIVNGRYRVGRTVVARFTYDACNLWTVRHIFNGTEVVGVGSLTTPNEATTEISLNGLALGDHFLTLALSDVYGEQVPEAASVLFQVVENDQIISS